MSYGIKSDGKIYHGSPNGENYSDKFISGDIIGCGINFELKEIFFTMNGKYLGSPFQ